MRMHLLLEIPDPEKLKVLFDELEFRTVAAKILAEIDKSEKPSRTGEDDVVHSERSSAGLSFRRRDQCSGYRNGIN